MIKISLQLHRLVWAGFVSLFILLSSNQSFATEEAISEVKSTTNLSEEQIPLTLNETIGTGSSSASSSKMMMSLFIMITLVGGGYWLTKKYTFSNKVNKSNMQIKVQAQHYLGPKKSLAIIRVAGESILIGVTDSQISMIKSLSLLDDEIPEELGSGQATTFNQALVNQSAIDQKLNDFTSVNSDPEDDFSFGNVKANVIQKIKNMRNI